MFASFQYMSLRSLLPREEQEYYKSTRAHVDKDLQSLDFKKAVSPLKHRWDYVRRRAHGEAKQLFRQHVGDAESVRPVAAFSSFSELFPMATLEDTKLKNEVVSIIDERCGDRFPPATSAVSGRCALREFVWRLMTYVSKRCYFLPGLGEVADRSSLTVADVYDAFLRIHGSRPDFQSSLPILTGAPDNHVKLLFDAVQMDVEILHDVFAVVFTNHFRQCSS